LSGSRSGRASTDVLVVAGEASGDLHGATLARALTTLAPGLRLAGMGGARMETAGVRLVRRAEHVTVVGGTEVFGRLPALWSAFRALRHQLRYRRPGVLVLIDFPEFNLRLARVARRFGVPVVYFVAPQLWAWRRGRVRAMARDVNRVLAIFPFEVGLYQEAGVPVEFVGHPVLDVLPALDRDTARSGLATDGETLVGLLPGSRDAEVRRHLPVLLDAAGRISARRPRTRFAVPVASTIGVAGVAAATRASGLPVEVLPGEAYRVMAAADLVLVASGTATLETACYGTPMVVLYRLSAVSHALARRLVRGVSHISLPNIVAGRQIVPEFIQGQATPGAVAGAALELLEDEVARAAQRAALLDVRARLGEAGAGLRAARAVLRERDGATGR
jgi:lipid-A-disaccharide synthase